jgi:hypothetical protein
MTCVRLLLMVLGLLAGILGAASARATEPYQGIYVVIDPYNPGQIGNLQTAATTACVKGTTSSPFCGATNGILLRVPWCDFQLYHEVNNQGVPYPSCHYITSFAAKGTSGVQTTSGDKVSPCDGTYDTCTGANGSVMGVALGYIKQINQQRAAAGLSPVLISLGMYAGSGTPESVLDSVGYVDVPTTTDATLAASSFQCMRLPLSWSAQFISDYDQAFDQLLAYIKSQMPDGINLTLVKVAGINSYDLELVMPGAGTFYAGPPDPGPAGPGPALNCSKSLNGAQVWLNAYQSQPVPGENFAQANEAAFASIIGHQWATIANDGLSNVTLSVATTNTQNFALVDCGPTETGVCFAASPSDGLYSTWYFYVATSDLFNGGLAYQKAAAAYQAARAGAFDLTPAQLAVDSTGLSATPYIAMTQQPCNFNNKVKADAPTYRLDGGSYLALGMGTVISYQTATNQGSECRSNSYNQALQNGISQGALFLEVETDAAFQDSSTCYSPLSTALKQILAMPPPTVCKY